jgi:glycosyltransferase involved in cell wall biosynthesis
MSLINISVAMATFNGSRFIDDQLESLESQSLRPCELVVTDDGSTDDTLEKIRAFGARASFPVRIYPNDIRLGYQRNFVKAASLCTGEFVAFCDQDDIWMAEKLKTVIDQFVSDEILLVHHNAFLIDEKGGRFGVVNKTDRFARVTRHMCANPWEYPMGFTQVFRRDLCIYSNLFESTLKFSRDKLPLPHDHWFGFLATSLGSIAYIDKCLVGYRQHGSNVFGYDPRKKPSWYEQMRRRLSRRSEQFAQMERLAHGYTEVLDSIAFHDGVSPGQRQNAKIATTLFAELGKLYHWRAAIYEAPHFKDRANALVKLIEVGGYVSSPHWSFQTGGLARDFVLGVFLGPLVFRFGRRDWWGDKVKRVSHPHQL